MREPAISAQAYSSNSLVLVSLPAPHCISLLTAICDSLILKCHLQSMLFSSSMPLKIMSNKMKLKTNLSGIALETCPCSPPYCLPLPPFFPVSDTHGHLPFTDCSNEALQSLSLDLCHPFQTERSRSCK